MGWFRQAKSDRKERRAVLAVGSNFLELELKQPPVHAESLVDALSKFATDVLPSQWERRGIGFFDGDWVDYAFIGPAERVRGDSTRRMVQLFAGMAARAARKMNPSGENPQLRFYGALCTGEGSDWHTPKQRWSAARSTVLKEISALHELVRRENYGLALSPEAHADLPKSLSGLFEPQTFDLDGVPTAGYFLSHEKVPRLCEEAST